MRPLGDDGYAFANVNAVPEIDQRQAAGSISRCTSTRAAACTCAASTSSATRARATKWSGARCASSKAAGTRPSKLTAFEAAHRPSRLLRRRRAWTTPSVPGTPDQVDVNVNVAEKPTGSDHCSARGSAARAVVLSGGVTQQNVFGSGTSHIGVQINSSKINTVYSLSVTSAVLDGRRRQPRIRHLSPEDRSGCTRVSGLYETSTTGAQARIGIPFTDIDYGDYGRRLRRYDASPLRGRAAADHKLRQIRSARATRQCSAPSAGPATRATARSIRPRAPARAATSKPACPAARCASTSSVPSTSDIFR